MVCNNFQKYIDDHMTEQITVGKSGASVYELDQRKRSAKEGSCL